MTNKLVIVESPDKARTLGKILGRGYSFKASLGHVRDLPRGQMGIDIENNFLPKYVIPKAKTKLVNELKKAADYTTHKNGGRGAVREVIELVLKTQGLWDSIVKDYYK